MVIESTRAPSQAPDRDLDAGATDDADAGVTDDADAGVIDDADAGVIDDARARQRRHRQIGATLLALAASAALLAAGIGGGGSGGGPGGGSGGHAGARPSGPNPGPGAAHAGAGTAFPGAPPLGGTGVQSDVCPMAAPNRYLPARSGCVSARLADVDGDGRKDLVIVYSSLGRRLPPYPGEPPYVKHDYVARAAFLRVVFANGKRMTTRVRGTSITRAAGIDAAAHVNALPGDELFIEVQHISSGATVVAYGFHAGRLERAGPQLGYGGDSGSAAGFNCVGHPPRVLQRLFTFTGPNEFTRSWRESEVIYAWRGARLVPIRRQTVKHLVALRSARTNIGQGCVHGLQ